MSTKAAMPASSLKRRQQLTLRIKKHALGARKERLDPVRVGHAVQCGKALTKAKELLGYGTWSRWLEKECALNRMTANRYIRLANRADLLTPDMTIREGYIAAGVIPSKPRPRAKPARRVRRA